MKSELDNISLLSSIIVKIFFTITIVDFSGDFILGQRSQINFIKKIEDITRYILMLSLIFVCIFGIINAKAVYKIKSIGLFCLGLFLVIWVYALIYGIIENDYNNAIRESQFAIVLFLIPIMCSLPKSHNQKIVIYFIYLLVIFSAVKIIIAQFLSLSIYGELSWKVLLRLSPLLILPFCYFLSKILRGKSGKFDLFYLLMVIIEILIANARALNLLLFIAFIFIVASSKFTFKLLAVILIFMLSAYFSLLATGGIPENIFGIWSGDHLQNTVDHRIVQLEILLDRFLLNPFFGFGFGYFTPGYDEYADLSLPYLLELDLINFFTKIGVPFSLLYLFIYMIFITQYVKNNYVNSNLEFSLLLSLILMLIYSLFQTAHSSFTFWIFYAMTFSFIFLKVSPGL
jgi:hypothetical protein